MNKIIVNSLEFFLVLAGMFLLFTFLSHILMKKIALDKLLLGIQKKERVFGNALASLIGALTPFCVCTTIPIFTAMIQMGINTNTAMSFLFASPLINISAVILIFFLFGMKFALYFTLATLVFSTLGGVLVYQLGLEGGIRAEIRNADLVSSGSKGSLYKDAASFSARLFKNLLIPLLIGSLIAGLVHNYVPLPFIQHFNRIPLYLAIPLMALIGFPLYSNILTLTPICFALVNKGMNPAVVMTFMMSAAGISLPTVIVLSKIFKKALFVYYLAYTFVAYCLIGLIFNILR